MYQAPPPPPQTDDRLEQAKKVQQVLVLPLVDVPLLT